MQSEVAGRHEVQNALERGKNAPRNARNCLDDKSYVPIVRSDSRGVFERILDLGCLHRVWGLIGVSRGWHCVVVRLRNGDAVCGDRGAFRAD